ncbi:MAG: alkaline phosphatase family protein, partial [Gammaproteobacteria bacterium]|nr:alkaline phosphatase family protein [Gammaproteobacteria bacterium]
EWSELSDLKFNIVNVQLTHPPKPINGKMISYLMNNTLNASYPRNLLSQLLKQGVRYAHDVSLFYKEGDSFDEFSEEAFRIAEYQLQTALELAKDSDILIVNLTLPDRLSHFLWYEMVDVNFEGRPKILKAYDFIDSACQQLQALASENVFVFSDTGFGELTEFVSINRYLQDAGLQKLNSDGTINLKQSFALETVQGSHGVMLVNDLNNKGEASPTQIDDLKKFLLEITFDDGTPVLAEANYREDIYQGDYTYLAPSFVVKPTDEKRPPLGDTRWASHVSRNSQSAWHRDKGFFIYDGSLTINNDTDEVKLQQVATSIAQASNRDPHAQCELASVF